jgi:hypothetical protein
MLQKVFHYVGNFLSLCGVIFIILLINSYYQQLNLFMFDLVDYTTLVIFVIVYALSNLLLAYAWWNLTIHEKAQLEKKQAIKIFGITQISKYIPGNIFHLANRQVMTTTEGVQAKSVAKTMLLEHGLLVSAGLSFIALLLPLIKPSTAISISYFLYILVMVLLTIFIRSKFSLAVVRAFIFYALFLLISGVLFWGVLLIIGTTQTQTFYMLSGITSAYVIAWLFGLVTPGAPAGIGVREYILMMLLNEQFSEPELLLAVLIGRLITALGDVIFFLKAKIYY